MRKSITSLPTLLCIALLGAVPCGAQDADDHTGQVDIFGLVGRVNGDDATLKDHSNVALLTEDTTIGGLGASYHFTNSLAVLFDLGFGSSDVTLRDKGGNSPDVEQDADYILGRVNLEFTWWKGPLHRFGISPVLTTGIGFANIQTDIPGAPPEVVCAPGVIYWWCGVGVPVYDETSFSYNAGFGMRWDPSEKFFLKFTHTWSWIDSDITHNAIKAKQFLLQIGTKM